MRRNTSLFALLTLALAMTGGCASVGDESSRGPGGPVSEVGTGGGSYAGDGDGTGAASSGSAGSAGSEGTGTAPAAVPAEECGEGCTGIEEVPAGQLTAGEWRDLDDWELWLSLASSEEWGGMQAHWGYETTLRVPVRVSNAGANVIDAAVELRDASGAAVFSARTDSQGRAELFASLFAENTGPYSVVVTAGTATATVTDVDPAIFREIPVELAGAPAAGTPNLDLMFVVDTTGSMGDELWYIQAELEDVIARAREEAAQNFDLRLSMNFYRDDGDAYVVRSQPFADDTAPGLAALAAESANGGGDFPEAVDQALADAINDHTWSEHATARLLFLVLDAPPHNDQAMMARLRDANRAAAAHGVKIIPVAGSGIDKETEFLMRFLAVTTGGTYTFLTNHSGIGGDHIEPSIGLFKVWLLNDLLVEIISDEISPSTAD
ncbi:MAG: VWA domain-containing protein [Deltaproteobacteria bacterium]|nr:VWA domain-containing protein [Deltaproteobacteria bacterium]